MRRRQRTRRLMEIERGSEPLIAFLLVDQADHVSPAAKAEPVE